MTARASGFIVLLAVPAAIGLFLSAAGATLAESPTGEAMPAVLEGLPPAEQGSEQHSVTLSARLSGENGEPARGETLVFYMISTVFGERLMRVGEAVTDATGTASLLYEPTWQGEHTVVVRYGGGAAYKPAQTTFRMDASGPRHVHEDARFGLETPRAWAPLGIGLVTLAVWAALGFVMVRILRGIPAGAGPARFPAPAPAPLRPAPLSPALLLVTGLVLMALPIGWFLSREGGQERPSLAAESLARGEGGHGSHRTLPATLVQSVPAVFIDAQGQLTPDSADLPADVALAEGRVFVLDTNKGRVLTVTKDGKLARMFESDRAGPTSILRASAMTAHNGDLFVAGPLFGNIVVLSPSGRVEQVVGAQVPEGDRPFHPAGIAVTSQGQIWLSDSSNHRLVLVNRDGAFLASIGLGVASSEEDAFDTPGGIALDERGNLWVVDTGNRQVKKYSPLGVFLTAVGERELVRPKAVAVDLAGNVFVTDDELQAVLVFGPDGGYLGSIGDVDPAPNGLPSGLQAPHGIEVEGDLVYVMDRLSGLFVFDIGDGDAR